MQQTTNHLFRERTSGWSAQLRQLVERYQASAADEAPLISVITPTWNTDPSWFFDLARSLLNQSFLGWEWCIVDDGSTETEFHALFDVLRGLPAVKVLPLKEPRGISGATNAGLKIASGKYVCFVDHDDVVAREALARCVEALEKGADAVYSDSDKIDGRGEHYEPFFKPDWSPEYFRGVMYVGHLLCVHREKALAAGGFKGEYDGVQDYEFFLRYSEMSSSIHHIPRILYHWRAVPGSVAAASDAKGNLGLLQRRAVRSHLERLGLPANAELGDFTHRIKIVPFTRRSIPKVSIIIPTKDAADMLHKCLYTLFSKTTYGDFEVFCVDNETTDRRALDEMKNAPVERLLYAGKFNFSKANNLALEFATGEYLVFLNNDVEVITPDWLEQLLYYAEQDDVGAVGPLLLYADRTVQHAGVVLGCRGIADHVLRFAPGDSDGYAGSLSCAREVTAVTGACLMMRRSLYEEVQGFNEHFFTAYQDVDLCLKIREKGKRIIFTPRARLVHHESVSRGTYYDLVDHNLLLDSWEPLIKAGDPYYNPNFDINACDYSLRSMAASR